MRQPYIVIGSGPAGTSCAIALLAQGHEVLLIDGGNTLEPARAEKAAALSAAPPATWKGAATNWMREGMQPTAEGIPLKLTFGSDYPFRILPGAPTVDGEGVNTKFSLGKGGFSTVWGTSILPFRQRDIEPWPVTADDLAPHYRAVLDFMPVAQGHDALEEILPTFKITEPMPLSPQASALLGDMQSHKQDLRKQGITFGRSRLAVNVTGIDAPGPCVRCGLCMYGCPYGLLYSTAQTLDTLLANPNFRYAPGFIVQRLEEAGGEVRVHTLNPQGLPETLAGTRAFMAAGTLATTAIMLRSLGLYDTTVTFADSQYFLLPMLRLRGVSGFERGNLHTLAQLFVEIVDEELSSNSIHLQTYTYNDLFEAPIAQKLGPAQKIFPSKAFLSRLFLFQGYLHSDDSRSIEGRLERTATGDALHLSSEHRSHTTNILKKLTRKLARIRGLTGMVPLTPLMQPGDPGRGFHTGGSFPMSANPSGLETDTLGRPVGLNRIHIVDSSVLPSIASTTITFTAMANAHRIGTLAAQK